jgi:putative phosphoribosyl transferase
MSRPYFRNRIEAGRALAQRLGGTDIGPSPLVLALPRGGVPVGVEIAHALDAELDIFLVRKLGVPGQEELAMGAIASGGIRVLNEGLIKQLHIPEAVIEQVSLQEQQEIERREVLYRNNRPALEIRGRTVLLVDDGLATGATMLAAVRAVRVREPARVIVAVPVASVQACDEFRYHVDDIVCGETPEPFHSVGAWYEDFAQTSDAEVQELLRRVSHQYMG